MPVGSGETSWGVSDPVRVFTPRGSGAIGQGLAVLHKGGVLLADRWEVGVLHKGPGRVQY